MKHEELVGQKRRLRAEILSQRRALGNKRDTSRRTIERLIALPEFLAAEMVSVYVSTKDEVHTHELITRSWEENKQVAVPCCVGSELQLYRLDAMDELSPRTMGILEPLGELRRNAERRIHPSHVDLFIVPGVAFDRTGGRLGHGKGYYDRLLARAPISAQRIGLAFACQMISEVPRGPHDVLLNTVLTEESVHRHDEASERSNDWEAKET